MMSRLQKIVVIILTRLVIVLGDLKIFSPQVLILNVGRVYFLSARTVKRLRKEWGLLSTRQQNHTKFTISDKIAEIRKTFPIRGAENIRKQLLLQYNTRVSRWVPPLLRIYSCL